MNGLIKLGLVAIQFLKLRVSRVKGDTDNEIVYLTGKDLKKLKLVLIYAYFLGTFLWKILLQNLVV